VFWWCGLLVRTIAYLCVGLCRTVVRVGDVRAAGLFGVVHILGDQLLVGVLGGGEVPDPVPGLDVRGAVRDGYATAEGGFDAGPSLQRLLERTRGVRERKPPGKP